VVKAAQERQAARDVIDKKDRGGMKEDIGQVKAPAISIVDEVVGDKKLNER